MRECRTSSRTVRIPVNMYDRVTACLRTRAELAARLGRPATPAEVAAAMGETEETVSTRATGRDPFLDRL